MKTNETQICIVHHIGNSNQNFTLLKNLPDPLQRLSYIQEIGALRQSQPVDSNERLDAQCKCIPEKLSDLHGYHRSCYQRFTKNKDRLKSNSEQEPSTSSTLKTRRTSSYKIIFAKDCIFCNKEGRIWRKKVGEYTTQFDMGGGETIVEHAVRKNDHKLLTRIRGVDLFSV